jgi:hypothetical protein
MHLLCDLQRRPPTQLAGARSESYLRPLEGRLPPILLRSEAISEGLAGPLARRLAERDRCHEEGQSSGENCAGQKSLFARG